MKKLALSLILVVSLLLSGCYEGLVDNYTYNNLIGGITAKTIDNIYYSYDLETLTNSIKFDSNIQNEIYDEIQIENKANFKMFAFYLYVKVENTCTLSFDLYLNNNLLKQIEHSFSDNEEFVLEYFFDSDIEVSVNDNLVIKVSQMIDGEQQEPSKKMVFDNLIIFFKE